MKIIKNMAFSVRERLKNRTNSKSIYFDEILQLYAMERVLFRISISEFADSFILKGALLFSVWRNNNIRLTKDIDLLGKIGNSEENIKKVFQIILNTPVEDDGIVFYPDTVKTMPIKQDAEYHGVRVTFLGKLDTARLDMQVDVGFNDVIYPTPEKTEFPVILDFPKPVLFCYAKETAIAEKFEAMTTLGNLNSRMKDFYDLWLLLNNFSFEIRNLSEALKRTFEHRGVVLEPEIIAFSNEFSQQKQIQWKAFRKKTRQDEIPETIKEIITEIKQFILPAIKPTDLSLTWNPELIVWTTKDKLQKTQRPC